MSSNWVVWLNDSSLRTDHPVFYSAPTATQAIYIWDDEYLRANAYTFKRLLFVYDTLASMPVKIIWGESGDVLSSLAVDRVYVPQTVCPWIKDVADRLSHKIDFTFVEDEPLVQLDEGKAWRRFYQYWNRAERTVFLPNAGTGQQSTPPLLPGR